MSLNGALLMQLISKNHMFIEAMEEKILQYDTEFRKVHDSLENGFIQAMDSLCQEWIASPAGIQWLFMLTKVRYIHLSISLIG